MGTSYPDRTNATGIWKLKDITRNKTTDGTYPNLTIGDTFLLTGGNEGGSEVNKIESFNISTTGNAADFGDMQAATSDAGTTSSQVRCVVGGGQTPSNVNTMNYVDPRSAGNAADYGDLTQSRKQVSAGGNEARGIFSSGRSPSASNVIDFIQYSIKVIDQFCKKITGVLIPLNIFNSASMSNSIILLKSFFNFN